MKQQTFSDIEYSNRRKKTKRDEFLEIMNEIIPWDEWVALIKPYYFDGRRGRPPIGLEKMLRMYLLQIWFTLSDEGVEDAIYDSYAMRKFMGIDFMQEQVPDATTLLHFRRLIEESGLGKAFFDAINRCLTECGHICKRSSKMIQKRPDKLSHPMQKILQNCLPMFYAIAITCKIKYLAFKNKPVKNSGSDYRVSEKISPIIKPLVGCNNERLLLISGRNK